MIIITKHIAVPAIYEIQKIALCGTAQLLRRVLSM